MEKAEEEKKNANACDGPCSKESLGSQNAAKGKGTPRKTDATSSKQRSSRVIISEGYDGSNSRASMDPRAQRTEEQIIKAFDELLREKELSKITVTDLTKRAKICRKTFYLHYSSIDHLVDELIRAEMKDIAERLCSVPLNKDGSIDPGSLLNELSEGLLMSFNRRTELVKYVNTDQLINRLKPALATALAEKDALGLAEKLGPYLDTFVAFFCAGILAVYHQWVLADSALPMENVSALVCAAVAGGLTALTEEATKMNLS